MSTIFCGSIMHEGVQFNVFRDDKSNWVSVQREGYTGRMNEGDFSSESNEGALVAAKEMLELSGDLDFYRVNA